MFFATLANIIGAIILIAVILPWFLIAVVCILIMYVYFAAFYRSSAREIKVWTLRNTAASYYISYVTFRL
jgi:ABC-type multidrug transport system permease subunit